MNFNKNEHYQITVLDERTGSYVLRLYDIRRAVRFITLTRVVYQAKARHLINNDTISTSSQNESDLIV